ncbi:hypothetical protein AB0H94_35735 [Streptomyces purpurascens]|uniref:hypothetical protein n=1 Tax=Streptomyces purpurascens TaxID=1924 RepID=UPI0033F00EFC
MTHTVVAATLTVLLAGACTARPRPALPAPEKGRSDLIATAQQVLVNRCLHARGAAGPPPRQEVLFGAGPAELSITLTTGYTVRAHTDGLAEAHRYLYGNQKLVPRPGNRQQSAPVGTTCPSLRADVSGE